MNAMKLLMRLMSSNATGGNLLGSLLKKVTGGGAAAGTQPASTGGLGSLLGGLLGGGSSSKGAGGMLGSLVGGGLLGSLLGGGKDDTAAPAMAAPEANEQATLLIRAMCNAAKADGEVDQQEQHNIVGRLGDEIEQAEIDFVKSELESPLDVNGFAATVPTDMAANVYAVSVMAIKVDTHEEAKYLRDLAQGLNLDQGTIAGIHKELGVT